jgi:hypothetical protein
MDLLFGCADLGQDLCAVPLNVGINLGPDLDDLAVGGDEECLAAGVLHLFVGHKRDTVGLDDLVVRVGKELEAEGILRAPGLMVFDGVDADTEDDCVQGVILRHVALEAVGLEGAAGGLVLGVEVEDDPLAFVVGEADGLVFLGGQGEVGGGRAGLHGVSRGRCVGLDADAAGCYDGDDCCDPNCFAHCGFPFRVFSLPVDECMRCDMWRCEVPRNFTTQ